MFNDPGRGLYFLYGNLLCLTQEHIYAVYLFTIQKYLQLPILVMVVFYVHRFTHATPLYIV